MKMRGQGKFSGPGAQWRRAAAMGIQNGFKIVSANHESGSLRAVRMFGNRQQRCLFAQAFNVRAC